jgi:hypothetical protein
MEVTTRIYLMKDSHGNKTSVTVEEGSCSAQVCGMLNKDGEKVYFESEAYHISSFCDENNIELKVVDQKFDFDTLWNGTNK